MTDPFDDMSINEIAALTERVMASVDPRDAQEVTPQSLGVETSGATIPRSVKLTPELDRQCKARAVELGLTQSAYIRSLIERDVSGVAARPLTTADLPLILEFIRHAA
ncbi:hypothetical protein ABIA39_006702 [Nocardia sp. GAS34]|uniref:hypothetical protein n=1 Tax=unclassified Nocardia TaxID=2637762 RepID=UPI003D21CA2A